MHPMNPRAVYVTEEALDDARCVTRMNRMLGAMGRDRATRVNADELHALARQYHWNAPRRKGAIRDEPPDPMVFTTLKWLTREEEDAFFAKYPALCGKKWPRGRLTGFFGFEKAKAETPRPGVAICPRPYALHSISGCPFMCDYCGSLSEVVIVGLNIEEMIERLDGWLEMCPDQTLFKWDNASDTICFEPEYGATEMFVNYFARQTGKYFLLYAGKCADVDWLTRLDHRGKTILAFSLAGPTQSRFVEKGTATTNARIEAMRQCQEAGYLVRARFSPIVPVKNWREEYSALIRRLFERAEPDVVTISALQRMPAAEARQCMDMALWVPRFARAMDEAAEELANIPYGPLPHALRAEMYRFIIDEVRAARPDMPVSLCLESFEMWQDLGPELGMSAERFLCNCGPQCSPGTDLYRDFAAKPDTR